MSSSGLNLENFLIPLEEINHATENFSSKRCIGGGGFGMVYKGELSERWQNRTAAFKRLSKDSYQGVHEFRNEVEIISRCHHENIISFIGYCDEENEMIIVYEYASNGSLDNHLNDPKKMCCLTWTQRLGICIGAARALNYLHSGLGEHFRVIHRDLKSANILLDENLVAKICDFGLSKFGPRNQPDTQLYTKVAGTQFYLDPAYHESGILHKESDVYSFGVVLFEMLSGLPVYSRRSIGDNNPQALMHLVRRYYHKEPDKLIDHDIRDHINNDSFDTFIKIAYQCISLNLAERPMMDKVLEMIQEAFDFQENVAILIECIKENIGFSDGKPVAAFTIYKSLLHYKYLEAERTNVFNRLIQIIIAALVDQDDNNKMAYWLSNASNLLFLIHKSLELHGESSVTPQTSLFGRMTMGFPSSMSSVDDLSEAEAALMIIQKVEAKEPALLFKKQLTECVEEIYGVICDKFTKYLRSLLNSCILAPHISMEWLKSERSRGNESEFCNWRCLVDCLNTLLHTLKENFVPPIIVRMIFAKIFRHINVLFFNSLLRDHECCRLSNVKHVKNGLAKLELWCYQAKKEYVGSAWYQLSLTRQAIWFLLSQHNSWKLYGGLIIGGSVSTLLNIYMISAFSTLSKHQMRILRTHYYYCVYGHQRVKLVFPSQNDYLLGRFSMPSFLKDLSTSLQVKDFANVKPTRKLAKYRAFHFLYN